VNVILDARDVDSHRLDRHVLDLAIVVVTLVRIDDLDAEHGGQRANQRIDELRLLRHEQRPALLLGERDVDLIDDGRHRVRDYPPHVRRQLLRVFLQGVCDDQAAVLLIKVEDMTDVHLAVRFLRTFDAHLDDQVVLRPQMNGERIDVLDIGTAVDTFSRRLDDDVDLMQCAPHAHHIELSAPRDASDETSVAPSHRVLAVRRRVEQLNVPIWVERVKELAEQIVQDLCRMAIEQRKANQVKVAEPAFEADPDV